MNELHTIVNNVHENWWIIWLIWLLPYEIALLCFMLGSDRHKTEPMELGKFYEFTTLTLFVLTILYWII